MFNEDWVLLILALLLLGAIVGQSALVLIPILLVTVVAVAWLWNHFVLRRVTYVREFSEERLFAGETLSMAVAATNAKPLPVPWLRIDDLFPAELSPAGRRLESSSVARRHLLIHTASFGPSERVRWTYDIACEQRGFYFFGPATLTAGDIFGMFQSSRELDDVDRVIVYPQIVDLPELEFPGKQPFGDQRSPQRLFEDPSRTIGVREYRPEDSLRRIHWKATARQADLQVKVYQPTITQQLAVFLNVATYAQPWMGVDRRRQEQIISIAASTALHATERRYAVGLIANGSVPGSDQPIKVLPGRAPYQLTHILEALAAVTSFATSRLEEVLRATSPELAWGATCVVVTPIVTEGLLAEMLRLRDAGRRMVLVTTDADFDSRLAPGIATHHIEGTAVDFTGGWDGESEDAPEREPELNDQAPTWAQDDEAAFAGRWDGDEVAS